jgi:hypothetical protein
MSSKAFYTPKPGRGGWTEWQQPKHKKYLSQCCDCGLVHEMQFAVVKFPSLESNDATFLDDKNLRVVFRVRREKK